MQYANVYPNQREKQDPRLALASIIHFVTSVRFLKKEKVPAQTNRIAAAGG
jgi:hypothetical protein